MTMAPSLLCSSLAKMPQKTSWQFIVLTPESNLPIFTLEPYSGGYSSQDDRKGRRPVRVLPSPKKKKKKVVLVNIKDVSVDAKTFRFSLPDPRAGARLTLRATHLCSAAEKNPHIRITFKGQLQSLYTTLGRGERKGFIDLLIKYAI